MFKTAPDRVYLTGHSMGGHGTWNVGVLHPGRFAAVAPSAGWISYQSYAGVARPTGVFGRARASSNTLDYVTNLARRGAYIIHGGADPDVPVTEARTMNDTLKGLGYDVAYHEQPGAVHWWDGPTAAGTDCVDWPELFTYLKAHTFDPSELTFTFTTPAPWVSPVHSFVTVRSQADVMADSSVTSAAAGGTVTLTTRNVRSLVIDGKTLRAKGIQKLVLDAQPAVDVPDGPLPLGPQDGKRPGVHGPLPEVLYRPFCFVYPDQGSELPRRYIAYLLTLWSQQMNGHACALPLSEVTEDVRQDWNIVYVGVPPASIAAFPKGLGWTATEVKLGDKSATDALMALVFPEGERLSAAIGTPDGYEYLLYLHRPFAVYRSMPDWLVLTAGGGSEAGFFSQEWAFVP
jgi:hypothetical protein